MNLRFYFSSLVLIALLPVFGMADTELTRYVDPYIGSGGHGHVFVGASVPFGAVQLGPSNFYQGWDWCSGYHYSDDILAGFSHLHLSGTGIADLGDILIMPYSGSFAATPGSRQQPDKGYASHYSHDRETVSPGYYRVYLDDYDIEVELTATERVGMHRYRLPEDKSCHLAFDLQFENGSGRVTESFLKQVDERTLVGHRFSQGWAKDQRVYFAIKASTDLGKIRYFDGEKELPGNQGSGKAVRGFATFYTAPGELLLKVGVSPVSEDNALANIDAEVPHWRFDEIVKSANAKWNNQLRVLRVETDKTSYKKVFYTALYHAMIAPVLHNDHNGDYRGTDKEVYQAADFDNYSIFSLWDTYRAAHPLFTLTHPERVSDFIHSMLAIYDQQGKLPVWHLLGNETNTMIGYHSVPVIVDAYFKGLNDFDIEEAYQAIKASAMLDEEGMDYVKKLGYIPSDTQSESVAKALEYCIDDWCVAQMAQSLGYQDDCHYFTERAKYYQHYFDPTTGFMRGKLSDGSWREPFDPSRSTHRKDDYCEGNGWQYVWLVPQDPEGLIELLGGDSGFTEKLDQMFSTEYVRNEHASVDITGLIGQYAHGNEPGHHTTYLYAYAGQQWKAAEKVRYITTELYHDQPDGLSGNEDCGQMSAWFILSSIGMYPVNPAAGIYVFGSPLFDKVTLQLPGGREFRVVARNNSSQNLYIQSVRLNGKPYRKSYITHKDIVTGGELTFEMGAKPNKEFGRRRADRPLSIVH